MCSLDWTGGTSRVPAMQASVERLFGKKPKVKNPDQATAHPSADLPSVRAAANPTPARAAHRLFHQRHTGQVAQCLQGLPGSLVAHAVGARSLRHSTAAEPDADSLNLGECVLLSPNQLSAAFHTLPQRV
jgi:molecular chaperone DnaK (HSP70)